MAGEAVRVRGDKGTRGQGSERVEGKRKGSGVEGGSQVSDRTGKKQAREGEKEGRRAIL